jgi:hypothetical protein
MSPGTPGFENASAVIDGHWQVPDGWQQGRGAWGGLVVAAHLRAVLAADPHRDIRTISCQIPAPVPVGAHSIELAALRQGSGMSTWSSRIVGHESLLSSATVLLAVPRTLDDFPSPRGLARCPEALPADEVPVIPVAPPLGPVFAQHLQFRPIVGVPLSAGEPRCAGWIDLPDGHPWDAVRLLAVVDAWWPCVLVALPTLRPMATVDFTAHLLVNPATVPSGPLLFESQLLAEHEGFTTEVRRLWTADGRLAVENLQSIAVIR